MTGTKTAITLNGNPEMTLTGGLLMNKTPMELKFGSLRSSMASNFI